MFIEKDTISLALKDRTLVVTMFVTAVIALILIGSSVLQISPSDIQIPVKANPILSSDDYKLYRDQWFYLLSFVGAGVLILVGHPLMTLKLLQEKGRDFALGFAAISALFALISLLLTLAIFRVVSVSL